jgi:antirestriction protein ArdC
MYHPEYINSWLQILQADSKAIFTAAAKAENAADFVVDKAAIIDCHAAPMPAAA